MSTVALTDELDRPGTKLRTIASEQHTAARVVGFLYVLQMATGMLAFYARDQLIVGRDAVQTAANIVASERLFRISIVTDLITFATVLILVWALYVVLEPVDRNMALLAAFFRLAENSILAVTALNAFAVLALLSGTDYLRAFETQQLQALAYTFLRVYGAGFQIGFVFLGLGSAVFSYVWFKSRYIPRVLAAWGIFSSLVLAIVTLAVIVFPSLAAMGLAYMVPMFFYEVGLGLWLLVKGIHVPIPGADSTAPSLGDAKP